MDYYPYEEKNNNRDETAASGCQQLWFSVYGDIDDFIFYDMDNSDADGYQSRR